MRAVARRFGALPLTLALTVSACSGGEDDTPSATVPTATTATTAAASSDPYAIPAVIDIAYVQRVFDALDQIQGEVIKEFLTTRQLTFAMTVRLGSVYNRDELERTVNALKEQLTRDFSVFKQPPGIRRTVVRRILTARRDCVSVAAEFDSTGILKDPGAPTSAFLALQPTDPALDPSNINPTPYSIFSEDQRFRDPCAVR